MANEIPNRAHASGVFVTTATVVEPFTSRILGSQGVQAFERLGVGQYLVTLQRPLAFSEGYVDIALPANFQGIGGAQLSQDGGAILVSVLALGSGLPIDPASMSLTAWAVQQGEGQGPALPFPALPSALPGTNPLSNLFVVDPGTGLATSAQTGSQRLPFKALQQAINAYPVPETLEQDRRVGGIFAVGAAQFDEDLTVDCRKKIVIYSDGAWKLGNFNSNGWNPTGPVRNITIVGISTPSLTPSKIDTGFSIQPAANGSHGLGQNFAETTGVIISGKLKSETTGTGFVRCSISADILGDAGVSIQDDSESGIGLTLDRCRMSGSVGGASGKLDLQFADRVRFSGVVSVDVYREVRSCRIQADWTALQAPFGDRPGGFIDCAWNAGRKFTGPPGTFVANARSNGQAKSVGLVLVGASPAVVVDSLVPLV